MQSAAESKSAIQNSNINVNMYQHAGFILSKSQIFTNHYNNKTTLKEPREQQCVRTKRTEKGLFQFATNVAIMGIITSTEIHIKSMLGFKHITECNAADICLG